MNSENSISKKYDRRCRREFCNLYAFIRDKFETVCVECPYKLPYSATFHQAYLSQLSDYNMELLLFGGFRRNGDWLYSMTCRDCASCLSIRLETALFTPNRNQRRVLRKNEDVTISLSELLPTEEQLELCDRFLQARYPDKESSGIKYYSSFFLNSITNSMQMEYRVDGQLMGTAIIDVGKRWVNAVYFFFDPEFASRSPGTFNILQLVNFCREHRIDYLYLGYLIHELPAMNYKKNFRPYQILVGDDWQTIE